MYLRSSLIFCILLFLTACGGSGDNPSPPESEKSEVLFFTDFEDPNSLINGNWIGQGNYSIEPDSQNSSNKILQMVEVQPFVSMNNSTKIIQPEIEFTPNYVYKLSYDIQLSDRQNPGISADPFSIELKEGQQINGYWPLHFQFRQDELLQPDAINSRYLYFNFDIHQSLDLSFSVFYTTAKIDNIKLEKIPFLYSDPLTGIWLSPCFETGFDLNTRIERIRIVFFDGKYSAQKERTYGKDLCSDGVYFERFENIEQGSYTISRPDINGNYNLDLLVNLVRFDFTYVNAGTVTITDNELDYSNMPPIGLNLTKKTFIMSRRK